MMFLIRVSQSSVAVRMLKVKRKTNQYFIWKIQFKKEYTL
jgi:hypothetical protein